MDHAECMFDGRLVKKNVSCLRPSFSSPIVMGQDPTAWGGEGGFSFRVMSNVALAASE